MIQAGLGLMFEDFKEKVGRPQNKNDSKIPLMSTALAPEKHKKNDGLRSVLSRKRIAVSMQYIGKVFYQNKQDKTIAVHRSFILCSLRSLKLLNSDLQRGQ